MQLDYVKTAEKIRKKLAVYVLKNRLGSLVVGISGGIDSALTAALASPVCKEIGIPLIGRSITIESNHPDEVSRAKKIGTCFCSDFEEVDFTARFKAFYDGSVLDSGDLIDRGNAKARTRMMYLYGIARRNFGIVLSTDNWTELLLGFFTLHGDVGDLGIIQDLPKTDVYNMTEILAKNNLTTCASDALLACVEADATDGLGISKTDLDQILPDWNARHTSSRSGYAEVDERLKAWTVRKADPDFPSTVITHDPIINRNIATEGKRTSPVNFKLEDIAVYVNI